MEPIYSLAEAIEFLKQGFRVRKLGWSVDEYLFLSTYYGEDERGGYYLPGKRYRIENHTDVAVIQPVLVKTNGDVLVPYLFDTGELLDAKWLRAGREIMPVYVRENTGERISSGDSTTVFNSANPQ